MTTGIVHRIDKLGRIVVPIEMYRQIGISNGDSMEIRLEGDHVELWPCVSTTDGYEGMITRVLEAMNADVYNFSKNVGAIVALGAAVKALRENQNEN